MRRGRARRFDHDAALAAAEGVFRAKGFSGAGITELMAAMEIGAGSFYSAFSAKENLYHLVLDRASERIVATAMTALKKAWGWEGLENVLEATVAHLAAGTPPGCVFSLTGAHQTATATLKWKRHRAKLHQLLAAHQRGLGQEYQHGDLAAQMMSLLDGLAVKAALGAGRASLLRSGHLGLQVLHAHHGTRTLENVILGSCMVREHQTMK